MRKVSGWVGGLIFSDENVERADGIRYSLDCLSVYFNNIIYNS